MSTATDSAPLKPKHWALELSYNMVKKIQNKKVARFGSYGWSGGAQRRFESLIEPLKWDLTDSFEFVGSPSEEDLKRGEELGARFARIIKSA